MKWHLWMSLEWKILCRDRLAASLCAAFAVSAIYALWAGNAFFDQRRLSYDRLQQSQARNRQHLKRQIKQAESGRTFTLTQEPRSPANLGSRLAETYAAISPVPLSRLAIGQSDLQPWYYRITTQTRSSAENTDELENPLHLLTGRLDLSFVLLYLYPLVIIGLLYNVLSAEKEAGRLALACAQLTRPWNLSLAKTMPRAMLVLLLMTIFLLGPELPLYRLAGAFVFFLYASFWIALALWINASTTNSAANALKLAAIWLIAVLIVPSTISSIATLVYPVPSRIQMIQALREATNQANHAGSSVLAQFYEDHPELVPNGNGGGQGEFESRSFSVQAEVERQLEPIYQLHRRQLDRQSEAASNFRFLSPAAIAFDAFSLLSGTSTEQLRDFEHQADIFHRSWRQFFLIKIFRQEPLSAQDIDQMPVFKYRPFLADPENRYVWRQRLMTDVGALAILSSAIGCFAWRAMRKYSVA